MKGVEQRRNVAAAAGCDADQRITRSRLRLRTRSGAGQRRGAEQQAPAKMPHPNHHSAQPRYGRYDVQ